MRIRIRYKEWLPDDRCVSTGPSHFRIVQVPEGITASTLCDRFDDKVLISEFVYAPVGESDGYSVGKNLTGLLEDGKMYSLSPKRRKYREPFLRLFKAIKHDDEILK